MDSWDNELQWFDWLFWLRSLLDYKLWKLAVISETGGHLNLALMWLSLGMSKSIMALMRGTEVRSSAGYCTLRLLRPLYNSVAWWVKTHVNCLHCCWWNKRDTFWHSSYFTLWRRPRRNVCFLGFLIFYSCWGLLIFHIRKLSEVLFTSGDEKQPACILLFLTLLRGAVYFPTLY